MQDINNVLNKGLWAVGGPMRGGRWSWAVSLGSLPLVVCLLTAAASNSPPAPVWSKYLWPDKDISTLDPWEVRVQSSSRYISLPY